MDERRGEKPSVREEILYMLYMQEKVRENEYVIDAMKYCTSEQARAYIEFFCSLSSLYLVK